MLELESTNQHIEHVLARHLRDLMHDRQVNEAELSRRTKIPPATLHKILSGKTADPRISTLQTLAHYFELTVDALLYGKSQTQMQAVPILSWSDCIKVNTSLKKINHASWHSWIITEYHGANIYGLSSKPAMEPRFPKGTVLIINPDLVAQDGDLAIVSFPNSPEATLRELFFDGPTKLLLPVNPNGNKEQLNDSVRIIGVVIESRFTYQ